MVPEGEKQTMEKAKRSDLPEDTILEVLARLPAKSLCRFRCVSKAWRALISDPTFDAAQRSHAGPHLVGVFFGSRACRWQPEVRVMDMNGNVVRVLEVRVLGKDDGDVLGVLQQAATSQLNVIVHGERSRANAMVIDPAAGRACAVDTDSPLTRLSFGCAATSGVLKVLLLTSSQICKVATIVGGGAEPLRWRKKSTPPFFISYTYRTGNTTVNGVVYFLLSHLSESDAVSSSTRHIAAFDLESEDWKMINGPALGIQEKTGHFTLTEHKGTLGLVQHRRERNDEHYYATIWLLIDFNKSLWVKEYTIQMPRTWELTKLLGALDDGIILLFVNELEKVTKHGTVTTRYHYRDVIVFYNPSTKTFTKFKVIAGLCHMLFLYTGSLVS